MLASHAVHVIVIVLAVAFTGCADAGEITPGDTGGARYDIVFADLGPLDAAGVSDATGAPDTAAPDAVTPDTTTAPDAISPDTNTVTPDTTTAPDTATAPDTIAPDAASPDTHVPPTQGLWGTTCYGPGMEGCPCGGLQGCEGGLVCAETDLGAMCAEPCASTCTGDRRCGDAGGPSRICLPAFALLCAPCDADADCAELGARCLDRGAEGSFCGAPCGPGGVCPSGFTCAGAPAQCVPSAGASCTCNTAATALGATTSCSPTLGCAGERFCAPGGLTPCQTTVGPLCDPASSCCAASGCAYESTAVRCGASPHSTERECLGACGGAVRERRRWAHCTGSSASCGTSNLQWDPWAVVQTCAANQLCGGSGPAAACQTCPLGCSGGACADQPLRVICVDPGYGGTQPGPAAFGLVGRDVTWAISAHVVDWLAADTADAGGGGRWQVVLTRAESTGPSQTARAAACNDAGADRVLSVRVNGCCGDAATGAETFRVATTNATTQAWAQLVQAETVAKGAMVDRGVKTATFTMLTDTDAPAAMVFPGFLDSSADAAKLGSDTWRRELARGLLHAIQQSFGLAPFTPDL